MSTEISISQEDLDNLTYEQFLSQFTIYSTQKEARAKGYEAHHIEPICDQNKTILNDNCVRLTPFQHIIAHYLYARDYRTNRGIYAFNSMINQNKNKLTLEENMSIETLKDYSLLREQAFSQISEYAKENSCFKDPEWQKNKEHHWKKGVIPWNKGTKGLFHHTEEWKQELSKRYMGDNNPAKSEISRLHNSESQKKYFENHFSHFKGKQHTDESKEKNRLAHLGKAPVNKGKSMTDDQKKHLSIVKTGVYRWTNGVETIWSKECPGDDFYRNKKTYKKMSNSELLESNERKRIKREEVKSEYKKAKETGYSGSWNDFQKSFYLSHAY